MRFTKLFLLMGVALSAFPLSLAAQDSCYTPQEFEADRGLRLHTDIEVITLTCRYSTRGEALQTIYRGFVHKNARQIHAWENTIARAYADEGGHNMVIDNFRTRLANQKGNESAAMGPKNFCRQWADFVSYAAHLSPAELLGYVRQEDAARPTKRPPC